MCSSQGATNKQHALRCSGNAAFQDFGRDPRPQSQLLCPGASLSHRLGGADGSHQQGAALRGVAECSQLRSSSGRDPSSAHAAPPPDHAARSRPAVMFQACYVIQCKANRHLNLICKPFLPLYMHTRGIEDASIKNHLIFDRTHDSKAAECSQASPAYHGLSFEISELSDTPGTG